MLTLLNTLKQKQILAQKQILKLEPVKKVGQLWTVPSIKKTVLVVYTNGVEFVTTVVVIEKNCLTDSEKSIFKKDKKYIHFKHKKIEYILLPLTEGPMLALHLKKYVGTPFCKYILNQKNLNISELEIKLLKEIEPLRIAFYTLFESRNVILKKYNDDDTLKPGFNPVNIKYIADYFIK